MTFLSNVHLSCFLLSYLVAFGGEIFQLRSRSGVARGILIVAAAAGLIAHTAYLINRSVASGLPPLVGSSHDWLLVLAWLGASLYLLALAMRERITLGLFLLPIVVGLIGMAVFVDQAADTDEIRAVATHRWGMLHAATLVIGMGFVSAAIVCAVMYLLQYQKLRGKTSWLHRLTLPSLERLTATNRWLVTGTVVMLTTGLATGFILAFDQNSDGFHWSDPIVAGTIIVWGIMVVALIWLLKSREQTGRQIARLTLLAGGFLVFTVFGLMLVSGGVHGGDPPESEANVESTPAGRIRTF